MVGWHHWLNGPEYGQVLEDNEGQGSLVCCSSWSHRESDTSEWASKKKAISSNVHTYVFTHFAFERELKEWRVIGSKK